MKHLRLLIALAVLAASLGIIAAPAFAQTADECNAQIEALKAQTTATTFVGQNATKDQAGLIGKLESAQSKLAQGKNQDAIANLTSFRDKVATLAAQGKVSQADADALIAGANEAIACVQRLTTTTTTA